MAAQTLPSTLDLILDLSKIKSLTPQQIEYLWITKASSEIPASKSTLRESDTNSRISSIIPSSQFKSLELLVAKNKQFILPVQNPATQQLDIHYLQWQVPPSQSSDYLQLLVIKLADYQRLGAAAPPHTVIYFYKDLSEPYAGNNPEDDEKPLQNESLAKGLVLMKGEILEKSAITVEQLQFLILNLQKFYGVLDGDSGLRNERLRLLMAFNKGDPSFDFNKLVELAMNTK
ncbi:hypothetical protein DASC09_030460 [Saccharomycopsis crataegensis]|uniref:Uncharacterized protein n=1 Tax=Saccharomycopsis crataegensis TaxID=43959 RepID=A0AAV5QM66_9ASCO|nr:hypothetical protein DASC09_030460 [Saccharomycopsis crataegensis]